MKYTWVLFVTSILIFGCSSKSNYSPTPMLANTYSARAMRAVSENSVSPFHKISFFKESTYNAAFCEIDEIGISCNFGPRSEKITIAQNVSPLGIATGPTDICAIYSDEIRCWDSKGSPTYVKDIPSVGHPRQIVAGAGFFCALGDGGVKCWGRSGYLTQIDVPRLNNPSAIAVSVNGAGACALDDDGLKCWGGGWNPTSISDFQPNMQFMQPKQLGAGRFAFCALDNAGLHCWSSREYYFVTDRLNNFTNGLKHPTKFSIDSYDNICAIDDDGVKCSAENYSSDANPIIATVPKLLHPYDVFVNHNFACAGHDGGVKCWGNFVDTGFIVSSPRNEINAFHRPRDPAKYSVQIGGDDQGSCALVSQEIKCWGSVSDELVKGMPHFVRPFQISVLDREACAVDSEGVKCWGSNAWVSGVPKLSHPKKVVVTHMQKFGTGDWGLRACAMDDTEIKCWGEGLNYGETENWGVSDGFTMPQPVDFVVGDHTLCAIDFDSLACQGVYGGWHSRMPIFWKDLDRAEGIWLQGDAVCVSTAEKSTCWDPSRGNSVPVNSKPTRRPSQDPVHGFAFFSLPETLEISSAIRSMYFQSMVGFDDLEMKPERYLFLSLISPAIVTDDSAAFISNVIPLFLKEKKNVEAFYDYADEQDGLIKVNDSPQARRIALASIRGSLSTISMLVPVSDRDAVDQALRMVGAAFSAPEDSTSIRSACKQLAALGAILDKLEKNAKTAFLSEEIRYAKFWLELKIQ